ncbi:SIS domain-containing protein [Streptococcus orisasini]
MNTETVTNYIKAIEENYNHFLKTVAVEDLEKAADLILTSQKEKGRVHVTGIGKPSHVAQYISALLSSTGTKAYFLDATEAVHGSAGQVESGDVVIAISNSGETSELKATVSALKNIGAKLIGVSGGKESWLKKESDVFLYAGVASEGDSTNKPPRLSILAEVTVLQCLSILLQEASNLTMEKYYRWHPGGRLGDSVKKQLEAVNKS